MASTKLKPDCSTCCIQPACCLSALWKQTEEFPSAFLITQIQVKKGSAIWINQGIEAGSDYLYMVYSGVIACITHTLDGDINCHSIKGKGQTANEMSLFSRYDYPYVAIALTDVTVCRAKSLDVENLLLSNPAIVPMIFASIFESITGVQAYMNILVMRSVYERIKAFSLLMAECLGRTEESINITLTHTELACLIKANRVTVTRVLSQLEEEGFIERGNKYFTLLENNTLGM